MSDITLLSPFSNLDRYHTQCHASILYLEELSVRVYIQLSSKNHRRKKKVYTTWKSEKILSSKIQHPVIDLKMEPLI